MKRRLVAMMTIAVMILAFPVYAFGGQTGTIAAQEDSQAKKKAAVNETFYVKGTDSYSYSQKVLNQVNQERKKAGKQALIMDEQLQKAAMQRAAEIALYFSHERPDGTMCFSISEKVHGENIAMGQSSASDVMTSWMNSSGHRANILGENYSTIGVGCFLQGNNICWVQIFSWNPVESKATSVKNKTVTHSIQAEKGRFKPYFSSKKTASLGKGKSLRLEVNVTNLGSYTTVKVEPKTFQWSSSKSSVASVKTSGTITGKKAGSATIKAKLPASGQTISKKVTVVAPPKRAVVRSVKRGTRSLKITWKRDSKASGYQVVIAKDKNFKKGKKSATITKNKTTSKTFKKLTGKKTYYIKVRSYKKVGSEKLYGSYSKVKKAKVK